MPKKREVPTPRVPAAAPLPTQFYGEMCIIECIDKELFTLRCEDAEGELVSFAMDEDTLRKLLDKFSFRSIPRIVSLAKYSLRIQVIPHVHSGAEEQILPLYPKQPIAMLDFGEDADYQPDHRGVLR